MTMKKKTKKKKTHTRTYAHEYTSYLTNNENNKWKYYSRLNACLFLYEFLCCMSTRCRANICCPAPHFPFNLIWCDLIYCSELWGSCVHKIVSHTRLLHKRIREKWMRKFEDLFFFFFIISFLFIEMKYSRFRLDSTRLNQHLNIYVNSLDVGVATKIKFSTAMRTSAQYRCLIVGFIFVVA